MFFICFILFLLISILTPSDAQVCASGWVKREGGGKCYLFQANFEKKWTECYGYCNNFSYPGAMMLCVLNETENDWLYGKYAAIKGGNPNGGWIGYSDIKKNASLPNKEDWYGWVPGCSSNYTNWTPGNPSNTANNEKYAHFWLDERWNDYTPEAKVSCACEYNPSAPSRVPTRAPSTAAPSKRPTAVPSTVPTAAPSRSCTTTVSDMGSCTLTSTLCCDSCTV
jgi:hypothetical protein